MTAAAKRGAPSHRITRMRRRYQTEMPQICVQRAKYFTAKWRELETSDVPLPLRVALSMKHVFENMEHNLDPDDRLAGAWSKHFLGWPIDIERGLFNDVLATELRKSTLLKFQATSYLRFVVYLVKKLGLLGLYRTFKNSAALGPMPVKPSLKTMDERTINPFGIDPAARRELLDDLLPYWRGKAIADIVARELATSGLYHGELKQFVEGVPNTPSKQALVVSLGAAIATYQGHIVFDHEVVLRRGLLGIKEDVEAELAKVEDRQSDEGVFLQSVVVALEGFIVYAQRLADRIKQEEQRTTDPERRAQLAQLLAVCRKVPLHPAETFREAAQAIWAHRAALETAHPSNVHAYGRLDQILGPYYERDVAAGRITAAEACELMEELLLKVMAQNLRPESNFLGNFYLRYEGSTPITLGGLTPEGQDATNELTYLLLDAADRSKSVTSIVVRVHKNTPHQLYEHVADILYRGTSNLSMMNDEVFVPAMKRHGFTPADANNYAITGCTDLLAPGKTGGISFTGLLLGHILDITLHNGNATTMIGTLHDVGPKTGEVGEFTDFEQLFDAFVQHVEFQMTINAEASNLRDRLFAEHMPAPCLSAFIEGCVATRTDITRGGAVYNYAGINMINSLANVVDSLFVIKKLVFDEKKIGFAELMRAVDDNFVGHENVHRLVAEVPGKWGNADPESDALARRVSDALFASAARHRSFKGDGPFVGFMNSMTSHTIDGRLSPATPDGRLAATPYAASCNPYNVERCGVTGVLRSVAAVDFTHLLGCAVNIRQHPSGIGKTPAARNKWIALMQTYFQMGGAQIQPTVASAETLRAAQVDPEAHRDLIVKVGGYSTYFVDLGQEIQNEIIHRTEHSG
ncbi:MAG: pyruvate formate lyase family protein [Candidatus Lernaella stagnicola]|nr:pyruvate formate lyase family protein [Candidatus Lernaella stagnicola]